MGDTVKRPARPILFSDPMVMALLDDRKGQTRRLVKPQPPSVDAVRARTGDSYHLFTDKHCPDDVWRVAGGVSVVKDLCGQSEWRCPYGSSGNLLWVRESHYRFGHWREVPGVLTKGGQQKWMFVPDTATVLYREDAPKEYRKSRSRKDLDTPAWHKRLARFMPRSASRITLEVAEVRVQLLRQINEEDARMEGATPLENIGPDQRLTTGERFGDAPYRCAFAVLWESINGSGSWEANPWVWCVSFKRVR